MTYDPKHIHGKVQPVLMDSFAAPIHDAFGRIRIAEPYTVFDSKQLHDKQPLFWDEEIVNSSGNATSTHSPVDAATTMHVEAGDSIVRQTFQRFNYQPGKSQTIFYTLVLGVQEEGVIGRAGYFDANNGVFAQSSGGQIFFGIRKAGVDRLFGYPDWNGDRLDLEGPSGKFIDVRKAQILVIDFEWLGVGTVRFGVIVDGEIIYVHYAHHTNVIDSVYMSSPNLPLRYEIASVGPAAELQHICSAVMSEGGFQENGIQFFQDMDDWSNANSTANWYALMGIRMTSAHVGDHINIDKVSLMAVSNDIFRWGLFFNPTVAGTFAYTSVNGVELAFGDMVNNPSVNTLSDLGDRVDGGYAKSSTIVDIVSSSKRHLGQAINGDLDQIVLAVNPLTSNLDIYGGMGWTEIV